jgi:hypothetical protein
VDGAIALPRRAIALRMQMRGCDRVEVEEMLDGVGFEAVKVWLALLFFGG